jgi:uncharacterized protein (DUF1684 family)
MGPALATSKKLELLLNDKPFEGNPTLNWKTENPDKLRIGKILLIVRERNIGKGARVSMRDPDTKARKFFKGLKWYPIKPEYKVSGKFLPDDKKTTIKVPNSRGQENEMERIGTIEFSFAGKRFKPVVFDGGEGGLFLVFRDKTSGKTTYPPGRFLFIEPPKDGAIELDFNYAIQPPCAFTKFATCPYPLPENQFSVPIKAGELKSPK